MTNCPRCDENQADPDYCSHCGRLGPGLRAMHNRLKADAARWRTPTKPVLVTLAPRRHPALTAITIEECDARSR